MSCECKDIINGVLAKHGATRIDPPLMTKETPDGKSVDFTAERVAIVTGFSGPKKRGETKRTIVACFCPFCGQPYDPETKYTGKPVVTIA